MKKKYQKVIDAVLDGELTKAQGRQVLEHLGAGKAEYQHLEQMLSITARLESLPQLPGQASLADNVMSDIRKQENLGAGANAKPAGRIAWALASAIAGAALAASITVPILRPEKPAIKQPTKQIPACRVRQVLGKVELERKAAVAFLQAGERLLQHDEVRAGENAQIEIDVDPDTRLVLYRESALKIKSQGYQESAFRIFGGRVKAEMLENRRRLLFDAYNANVKIAQDTGAFSLLDLGDGRLAVACLEERIEVTTFGQKRALSAGKILKLFDEGKSIAEEPITEKLQLEIDKPVGPLRPGHMVLISGKTDTHARVWIDNKLLETQMDGSFKTKLDIELGDSVEIHAEDVVGNTNTVELGPAKKKTINRKTSSTKPEPKRVKTKSYRITW